MKKNLLISAFILCAVSAIGQTKTKKYGITVGGYIQHYNGNLGNSFFKFNTVCFAGVNSTFGMYLSKSFDLNLGASIGHFGYCQTKADASRIVSMKHKCGGCKNPTGMGELRALMVSGNFAIKYKFANGIFLKENSKFAPYVYVGMGINHLSDNMKRECVNVGVHFTINGGAGMRYNITDRVNIGYNLGIGCFVGKKVYASNGSVSNAEYKTEMDRKMERRKDLYMQNQLSLGINFN